MNSPLLVDLFAEDIAHEEFIRAIINRLGKEFRISLHIRTRSARGGHGKTISEFTLFHRILRKGIPLIASPDIIVVAIDCNCKGYSAMQKHIREAIDDSANICTVFCCPDPHIERWYLTDTNAVSEAIGSTVRMAKKKCERAYYKNLLAKTVIAAGHPPALGGIEFAADIVGKMDFYHAGKSEKSLRLFISDISAVLKRLSCSQSMRPRI